MQKQNVVIKFCGDSGDGMQLTGNMFSSLSAILGNEISTLPDFPAEIRAPQGTLGGVSGFQVNLGNGVYTPGDKADVLVAMNAAALKVCTLGSKFNQAGAQYNEKDCTFKKNAVVIIDTDAFSDKDLEKALYQTRKMEEVFTELGLPESIQIVPVALTQLTKEALKDSGLDNKAILKSRNMFALGIVCWLFDRPMDKAIHFLEGKFAKKPALIAPNVKVLTDGFNYGNNLALNIQTIQVESSEDLPHGTYTSIAGNKATAWGLIAAAEKCGKRLFLGSYPITPATDIMHELAGRKDQNVMVVQAEDEIAGVCTAIGASFAGDLAATTTSGPGLSLKSEAVGLAVMAELPLVVVDVQRGGPSTGLPTKTEQTDLLQAVYGRNGECPAVVLAASTSANCFQFAYEAAKIALENMTPVVLLTDTYLANGTALWRIPKMAELPEIKPQGVPEELKGKYSVSLRDENNIRYWAVPGMEGYEHRNIGLERDSVKGSISTNPENHEKMTLARQAKVNQVANKIPELKVMGNVKSDTLLVGWGSTEGHIHAAADELGCAMAHFNYINPLPKNTAEVLKSYKRVIVCELNNGQFATLLRSKVSGVNLLQVNSMKGQPFQVEDIVKSVKAL
ncbi:MAG: 2-oxoacid:acceptor oxidoreductase subunit alpha [Paludibacteraceae bacterium]|nr:2-oxoacid:acceptor oxidoreductase subunit alpha [Paludibacteraceae bacterium]